MDLTITQKSFLIHGYQLYNQRKSEATKNNSNDSDSSYSERKVWEEKYRARQEENRQRDLNRR